MLQDPEKMKQTNNMSGIKQTDDNTSQISNALGRLNFNINFIWKEVKDSILKIIAYLKDNKIGEEIQNIFFDSRYGTKEISNYEKLDYIILILDKASTENRREELNIFFIEFYRLCALYIFCIDDKLRSYEIINKFINKIDESFKYKEETEIDVNLLVERDKLLLNKAQLHFWDEKYEESLEIIYAKIAYFQQDSADEIYCLKMINYIISALSYKAWIHAFQKDEEECEKSFLLAIHMVRDSRKLLQDNLEDPDLKEVYKRKIKTYHQYLNYLNFKVGNNFWMTNPIINSFIESSYNLVLQIIRLLNKDAFEYDEDILKSHLIYYYLQAALLSTGVNYKGTDIEKYISNYQSKSNILNKRTNIISTLSETYVDLENTMLFIAQAYVENISQDLQFRIRYRQVLGNCLYKVLKMICQFGKIVKKSEDSKINHKSLNNSSRPKKSLFEQFQGLESRLIELLDTFDEKGAVVMVNNINLNSKLNRFYNSTKVIKNLALNNISRFSRESMSKPVQADVNEIFLTEYICNKLLFVLAKIMKDEKEIFKNFTEQQLVMESLNGYLVVQEDSLILVSTNSLFPDYKEAEDEDSGEGNEKYINNRILNEIKLEKSETFMHFYTRHHFEIKKDMNLDVFLILIGVNSFYSLKLWKPCIVALNYLLGEFEKLKDYFSGSNENMKTKGYLDLYVFFVFSLVKIYIKMNDYFMAMKLLQETSTYDYDYTHFLYNILYAICLTKLKYCDLAAILFDESYKYIKSAFEECEGDFKDNLIDKDIKKDNDKIIDFENLSHNHHISEDFMKPIKMFTSVINLMKIKAIDKFQDELISNQNICFYCDLVPPEKKEEEEEKKYEKEKKNKVSCLKCNRAYYCSPKCMKKMKLKHEPVCNKYFEKFSEINELVDQFIK